MIAVETWVTPADPAAFPGIVGQVLEVEHVHHVETGEVCATYYRVEWQGPGRKPNESQESSAVVPARGVHYAAEGEVSRLLEQPGEGALLRERRAVAMRNLKHLGALRTVIEQQIAENVQIARTLGGNYYDWGAPTWADIGLALGVTKQAAQSRYGKG